MAIAKKKGPGSKCFRGLGVDQKNGPVVLEREAGSDLDSTSGAVLPEDAAERGRITSVRIRVVDTGSIENIGYVHPNFKRRAFSEP
jgi:hypothetical protein